MGRAKRDRPRQYRTLHRPSKGGFRKCFGPRAMKSSAGNLPNVSKTYAASGKTDYSRTDLVNGLRLTGLGKGDIVFFQVSHVTLGTIEGGSSAKAECELFYSA